MDINKVQKMNEMAMNLKRHNIVISKENAVEEAEKIYGTENNYIREKPAEKTDELDELRKEVRKLTFALRNMKEEFDDIKAKSAKLEQELNDARVGMVRRQLYQQPQVQAQQPLVEPPPAQLVQQEAKPSAVPIDRNKVAPSEVSIEKFFYFGQK
jgi:chromosome segregation ATPase